MGIFVLYLFIMGLISHFPPFFEDIYKKKIVSVSRLSDQFQKDIE